MIGNRFTVDQSVRARSLKALQAFAHKVHKEESNVPQEFEVKLAPNARQFDCSRHGVGGSRRYFGFRTLVAAGGSRPTLLHRHPCPPALRRCRRGTSCSWGLTLSAPRTTSASPQALASPTYSSRRRPPCSATTVGKSSPTTSAPTRLSLTLIQRWWPDGTIRATWQYRDTSSVWAKVHQSPDGAVTVDTRAIAWLLLDGVGTQNGPTGGDKLTETTFVQRLNTTGGLAPSTGCSSLTDVGNTAFVPYTADYFFYKKAD